MNMNDSSEFDDAYLDKETIKGAILTESISALNPKSPVCVAPGTTVLEAVQIMNRSHTGCVCVVDRKRLVGVFTERDILRKVIEAGLDVKKTLVNELMTVSPETLTLNDKIVFALNKMTVGGFRHVPIVEGGVLRGIVSIRDIAEFVVALFPAAVLNVPPDPAHERPARVDGG
jgi:CBS domain-containing protein